MNQKTNDYVLDHPIRAAIEGYLLRNEITVDSVREVCERSCQYRLVVDDETTFLIKLYTDEEDKVFIIFESGIGLADFRTEAPMLLDRALGSRECYFPFRVSAVDWEDDYRLIITQFRSPADIIAVDFVGELMDLFVAYAGFTQDRLRPMGLRSMNTKIFAA